MQQQVVISGTRSEPTDTSVKFCHLLIIKQQVSLFHTPQKLHFVSERMFGRDLWQSFKNDIVHSSWDFHFLCFAIYIQGATFTHLPQVKDKIAQGK